MKNKITALLLMLGLFLGVYSLSYAQGDSTSRFEEMIAKAKAQIAELQARITTLQTLSTSGDTIHEDRDNKENKEDGKESRQEMKQAGREIRFTRSIMRGMSGDDVKDLQEILSEDSDVYPEGFVTGYFGQLTEQAVKKFQKKHGLEQVGVFGPKTKAKFIVTFLGSTTINFFPPGFAKKIGQSDATTTSRESTVIICHYPPGNPLAKHTLVVGAPALKAHLAHGDTVGTCSGATATSTDTTAPIIFLPSVTASVHEGHVSWMTNEPANSRVWYATGSNVLATLPLFNVFDGSLVTTHTLALGGLQAATPYYFVIVSSDASGNTATSTSGLYTFTTGTLSISSLSATSASTTASISWNTNISANSKVWYATTSPVMSASDRLSVSDSSIVLAHVLGVSGLATSTTYHYLVVSTDALGTTATSSESSFATSP